jgi:hypothetical protein
VNPLIKQAFAALSLPVAIGAYEAACRARPKDRVLLCNMAEIIRDRYAVE